MKIAVTVVVFIVLVSSFTSMKPEIRWKKLDTKIKVTTEVDKFIHPGDDIAADYAFLDAEKHSFLKQNGDTCILFNSPEQAVHFGALVSRKWMFTFHYTNRKLVNYEVEKGLTGP